MRIKLTLRGRGPEDINLLVTTDNTATIGDLAAALSSAGPDAAAPAVDPNSVTLRLLEPTTGRVVSVLAPTAYVTESGLRSGAAVDIVAASQSTGVGQDKAAELHVISGPDQGRVVSLPFGSTIIGRTQAAEVALTDPMISKQHMRVVVGHTLEVHDLNSANGIMVGAQRVQRCVIAPQDIITIGSSQVQFVHLRKPEAGAGDTTDVAFIRPPQVVPHMGVKKFKLPQVPTVNDKTGFPFIALIAPLLMGVVMYLMTRNLLSIIFMILSPFLMIGNYLDQWRQRKRQIREGLAVFNDAMRLLVEDLTRYRDLEKKTRLAQFPHPEQAVNSAMMRDPALWTRRPEHPEFLKVRVGLGREKALLEFSESAAERGLPGCAKAIREVKEEFEHIDGVPIVVDLRAEGNIGVCGDPEWVDQIQTALVAQLVSQYSPAEVTLACFTSAEKRQTLDWLEWLPHVASAHSPLGEDLHLVDDAASGNELLNKLETIVEQRAKQKTKTDQAVDRGPVADGKPQKKQKTSGPIPAVVVLINDVLVDRARLNKLAESGPDYGIHIVWISYDFATIPAACRSFIVAKDDTNILGDVRGSRVVNPVELDRISRDDVARLCRSLSPVFDAGVPVSDDSDLPGSISYVQLTGAELADSVDAQIERWHGSHSIIDRREGAPVVEGPAMSLSALIGQGASGPVSLDLRLHGPHALVGGTTGAGKSEFLQAWVLGMAQAVSPDRLTFLFVDYKGGAAFARCTELPHCVGLVTDLSPFLVRRALESLRAELHYREKLLNRKGAKDLVTLEKMGDPECPPSLVIVVDEFAALVSEVPEFVDGVVDVAQRGRSLGLHLILATQQPSGVIKGNLRANTNLRVALRMADEDDSNDVLGNKMAAHFPQSSPGRGAAKTGPGRIMMFQSAYPGARTSEEAKAASVAVQDMGFGRPRQWKMPEKPKVDEKVETDIDRVVRTVAGAAQAAGIPAPRKPWLDELAQTYNIRYLRQRTDTELILGVVDLPSGQAQVAEYFRPDVDGNIAYYGASGSGKSTALRSLAVAAGITPRGGLVDVYGLDFGGGALDMLKVLPHVGDIVPGDDEERVARLLTMIARIVEDRQVRFSAARAGDLTAYRQLSGSSDDHRILLLIDSVGVFVEDYQTLTTRMPIWNKFQQILLDGRAVGVHVAVTADRSGSLPNALSSNFQRKVVLRQTNEDEYVNFGLPMDVLDSTSLPGRAMQVGSPSIMQIAIFGDSINVLAQARLLEELAAVMEKQGRVRPAEIGSLPVEVFERDVDTVRNALPLVGMEAESLDMLPFRPVGLMGIAGGPSTGRTNTLAWLVTSLHSLNPQTKFLFASGGRSMLSRGAGWTAAAQGVTDVAEMLRAHKHLFEAPAPEGSPGAVLVIEGFGDFVYSEADGDIMDIFALAKANGHLVIAEADLSGWQNGGQLASTLRSGRCGIVLCPSLGDGDSTIGVSAPALSGRDLVPGRGYFGQAGKMWKIQVPLVE